jgi:FtsH-binding integral membrane protein
MNSSLGSTIPAPVSSVQLQETLSGVMRQVYLWMATGLLVTAGIAWVVANSPLADLIGRQPFLFFGALIVELGLVLGLTAGINRLSTAVALGMFFVYAAVNGLTMSLIFLLYTATSIAATFAVSAGLFAIMSLLAYSTGLDLSRFRSLLLMGLIGVVLGSVVNLFFASSALYWVLTYVGIALFLGLTAYDTQRIRRQAELSIQNGQVAVLERLGIMGALSLYLDFVNLFLLVLRLMGRRR